MIYDFLGLKARELERKKDITDKKTKYYLAVLKKDNPTLKKNAYYVSSIYKQNNKKIIEFKGIYYILLEDGSVVKQ